jgi:hypothetical protein
MRTALVAALALAACSKDPPATTPPAPDEPRATPDVPHDAGPIAEAPPDATPPPDPCEQILPHLSELGGSFDDCDNVLTADDVACYLGATDLASTWPCYRAALARDVESYAKELMERMTDAATDYATEHHAFPIGKTGVVPKKSCCKTKDKLCHNEAATWRKGVWPTLLLDGLDATVFQVSYASSKQGDTFELEIITDVDCDGDLLVWALEATRLPGGDLRLSYADPEFDD